MEGKKYLYYSTDGTSAQQSNEKPNDDELQAIASGDLAVFSCDNAGDFREVDEEGGEGVVDAK